MMRIMLNGSAIETDLMSILELKAHFFKESDLMMLNGHSITEDVRVSEGDSIHFFKRGQIPNAIEMESLLCARHSPGIHRMLKESIVGIAGLGGLGSNIALNLARLGVGRLVVADFDKVDPTNLNRQSYFVRNIGMRKTDAIAELIEEANPFVAVETHFVKVDSKNVSIFKDCDVICEAFDVPKEKAMLLESVRLQFPEIPLVMGSGMAGYEGSNVIRTERIMKNIYVCGDQSNAASMGVGLMSPRVAICAGHMSNMVLRLLLTEVEE